MAYAPLTVQRKDGRQQYDHRLGLGCGDVEEITNQCILPNLLHAAYGRDAAYDGDDSDYNDSDADYGDDTDTA